MRPWGLRQCAGSLDCALPGCRVTTGRGGHPASALGDLSADLAPPRRGMIRIVPPGGRGFRRVGRESMLRSWLDALPTARFGESHAVARAGRPRCPLVAPLLLQERRDPVSASRVRLPAHREKRLGRTGPGNPGLRLEPTSPLAHVEKAWSRSRRTDSWGDCLLLEGRLLETLSDRDAARPGQHSFIWGMPSPRYAAYRCRLVARDSDANVLFRDSIVAASWNPEIQANALGIPSRNGTFETRSRLLVSSILGSSW